MVDWLFVFPSLTRLKLFICCKNVQFLLQFCYVLRFFLFGKCFACFFEAHFNFLHFFFKILWEHFKKWHWIDFILHKQVYFCLSCFAFVAIKGSGLAITKPPNKFLHYHINLSTTFAVNLVNLQNGIFDKMSSWKALLRYDCRKVCCISFWDWFCAPLLRTRWVCSIDTVHWLSSVAQ